MLKFITIITKFILVTLAALLVTSCNYSVNMNAVKGSGNVTTEIRSIDEDFNSIDVSNAIDVVLEQADIYEVRVEADDNLHDKIKIKVENGVLVISSDHSSFMDVSAKKVFVKMPLIQDLHASSSATIKSSKVLKSNSIDISTSSAAEISVNIESDNVKCESSSGSDIYLEGLALSLEAAASSGSEINAADLPANKVIAKASSGATIKVQPILSLKAKASSGSDITYVKTPKTIEKKESSGASISKE